MLPSSTNSHRDPESEKKPLVSKQQDEWTNMITETNLWKTTHDQQSKINEERQLKAKKEIFEVLEEESKKVYLDQMGVDENESFREKLDEITKKIAKAAAIEGNIECLAVRSDGVNAFVFESNEEEEPYNDDALATYEEGCEKGRLIFIYTGLVKILKEHLSKKGKTLTEGHIAAVIAHEMRHLVQQKMEPSQRPHTRKQEEYDADIGGVEMMGKAGYNPQDFLDVMESFNDLSGKIGYSSTHPAIASRIVEISSRVSSTDVPLFGLGAEKKALEELPVSRSRSSEMIDRFSSFLRQSNDPQVISEKIRTSDETYFTYLTLKDLLSDAMKFSIYQEIGSDPQLDPVLMKYLYIKGVTIAKEEERLRGLYEEYKNERDKLKQKKQSQPLNYSEKESLDYLEELVERMEKVPPVIMSQFSNLTRPEDNPWIQEWKKVNPEIKTKTAKTPAAQMQVEALRGKNIKLRIREEFRGGYKDEIMDMSNAPNADWVKIAQEWFENGVLSGEIGEKIQKTLSLWPNSRTFNPDPQYHFETEADRKKFKKDFFTNILSENANQRRFTNQVHMEIEEQTIKAETPFKSHVYSLLSANLSESDKEVVCQFLDPKNHEITIDTDHISEVLRILPNLIASPRVFLDGELQQLCSMRIFSEQYIYLILGRLSDKKYEHTQDPELVENAIKKLTVKIKRELHQLRNLSRESIPSEFEEKITWYNQKRNHGATTENLFSFRYKILSESKDDSYIHFLFLLNAYQISYEYGRNPISEADANTFLKAIFADGFDKTLTLDMLNLLYGSISESDFLLRLKIEAMINHLGSHISKYSKTSAIRNMKEISRKTGKTSEEIMKITALMEITFTSQDLISLVESNQITVSDLVAHYECYKNSDKYSDLEQYKNKILCLICILNAQECDPTMAAKTMTYYKQYGTITINGYEMNLIKLFAQQKWPVETILKKFPKCPERSEILYEYWKQQDFSDERFHAVIPHLDKENPYGPFSKAICGNNILSLKALKFIGLKDEEAEKDGEELYNKLSALKALHADEHVYAFYDNTGYLHCMEKKYEKDPHFFVNPVRSFQENRSIIVEHCPPCEFRDYLLIRALKIEVHKMKGKNDFENPKPYIPMIPHDLLKEKLQTNFDTISFYDDLSMPDPKDFDKEQKVQLISLLRTICNDIDSPQSKIAFGRVAIDQSPDLLTEKMLITILEFLPEASPARDDYLNNLVLKNRFSVEKIKEIESLLSHNTIQKGKVSEGGLIGLEVIRNELRHLEAKDRMVFLLWLLRMNDQPPHFLRVQGGMLGIHFESLRNNFSLSTNAEKKEFLKETLLFENGLFQPKNPEGEQLMEEFLEKIYESKFALGSGNSIIFKDIFMTVFKRFMPERRVALFTSLLLALEESRKKGEESLPFHEIACLFLEQSGGVAIKLGQILSESNEVPFSTTHEPMPPEFKQRLTRLKDGVEPFSTVGAVRRLEENQADDHVKYIDGLLSTASIKQAHKIETQEGKAVLKVRRPAIEHFQHDFEVLEAVFETLKRHGMAVPQYLIDELKAIIDDEKDFEKESENQVKIAENLSSERHSWTMKIPSIQFSSQDMMIEDFAAGTPLTNIKTINPKLYEEISRLIGMELLSGICEKGVFHADLHDGNIFVSPEQKTVTFIDAGAVGDTRDFKKPVLQLVKGLIFNRPAILASSIMTLSEHGEDDAEKKKLLKKQLKKILEEPITLEQKISKISFEILHVVHPKPALRYLLKALATGAHHFEHLGKNWDFSGIRNAGEISKYLLKIWMS